MVSAGPLSVRPYSQSKLIIIQTINRKQKEGKAKSKQQQFNQMRENNHSPVFSQTRRRIKTGDVLTEAGNTTGIMSDVSCVWEVRELYT